MRTNTEDKGQHGADLSRSIRSALPSTAPSHTCRRLGAVYDFVKCCRVGLVQTVLPFQGAYGVSYFPSLQGR